MSTEKEYLPKRAMSIHAHPDDQEFTVAGTLSKWARAGCDIELQNDVLPPHIGHFLTR